MFEPIQEENDYLERKQKKDYSRKNEQESSSLGFQDDDSKEGDALI